MMTTAIATTAHNGLGVSVRGMSGYRDRSGSHHDRKQREEVRRPPFAPLELPSLHKMSDHGTDIHELGKVGAGVSSGVCLPMVKRQRLCPFFRSSVLAAVVMIGSEGKKLRLDLCEISDAFVAVVA